MTQLRACGRREMLVGLRCLKNGPFVYAAASFAVAGAVEIADTTKVTNPPPFLLIVQVYGPQNSFTFGTLWKAILLL
jgi:hypothetical protein